VLTGLSTAADPAGVLAAYNPSRPEFVALLAKLAEIRASSVVPPPVVPEGRNLKLGMTDERVVVLRERLQVSTIAPDPKLFDDTVDLAAQARFAFQFCAEESCGKCTPCRIGSVRGQETIEKIMRGEKVASNLDLVKDLCETMRDGSLCALGGLIPMPVSSAIEHFPEDFDRTPHVVAAE
jgi:hypothetical protein